MASRGSQNNSKTGRFILNYIASSFF